VVWFESQMPKLLLFLTCSGGGKGFYSSAWSI
jgi:hypothetical protein